MCLWRLLTPLFGGFENFGSVLLLLGKIKDFCRLRIARTHVPRNKWALQISKQCLHPPAPCPATDRRHKPGQPANYFKQTSFFSLYNSLPASPGLAWPGTGSDSGCTGGPIEELRMRPRLRPTASRRKSEKPGGRSTDPDPDPDPDQRTKKPKDPRMPRPVHCLFFNHYSGKAFPRLCPKTLYTTWPECVSLCAGVCVWVYVCVCRVSCFARF